MVKVRNFETVSLSPKLDVKLDAAMLPLLPTTLMPSKVSLDLIDVSVAVANGLRRTCALEITGRALTFDLADFRTNNPFILHDFLSTRIKHIPIKQDAPAKAEFSINVSNTTTELKYVMSSDIIPKTSMKPIFNQTFPIATLQPNTSLVIKRIYITEGVGYVGSQYSLACQTACTPIDQVPFNEKTGEGTRSGMADPRAHHLSFVVNGGISGKLILERGCASIRERLRYIQTLLPNITTKDDMSMLVINGESDTIGNLLLKTIVELSPDAVATYETSSTYRALTFKLKTHEEPERVIGNAIKYIIEVYEAIEKQL
jgi:DNA-directed RNA polymerase subunit L